MLKKTLHSMSFCYSYFMETIESKHQITIMNKYQRITYKDRDGKRHTHIALIESEGKKHIIYSRVNKQADLFQLQQLKNGS